MAKIFMSGFLKVMNVNPISNTNFKGYDARRLKGFFMPVDCCGIAHEMKLIGEKEGFKVYSPMKVGNYAFKCIEGFSRYTQNVAGIWAQDMWMIVKDRLLSYDLNRTTDAIKEIFGLKNDDIQTELRNSSISDFFNRFTFVQDNEHINLAQLIRNQSYYHVEGGNVFIVKGDKDDELIIGEDEVSNRNLGQLKEMFSVDKVTVLPQMDYHIDLFIRPLDNKRILLADDKLTLKVLEDELKKLIGKCSQAPEYQPIAERFIELIAKFKVAMSLNSNPKTEVVENILKKSGYDVIKIPGRFYELGYCSEGIDLHHIANYINSNVFKNKDGELVYITNKSNLDKLLGLTDEITEELGFSFEEAFVETLSPYIKPEHIYFVKGDNNFIANEMLYVYQGGIHCACTEIPENEPLTADK